MTVSRRAFLGRVAATSVGSFAAAPAVWRSRGNVQDTRVDAVALRERLEELSVFGRPAGGTFADGVSRVAYSDADVAGRQLRHGSDARGGPRAAHRSRRQHLRPARRHAMPSLPPILFGSHIDSVPNGGNFDGDLGSLVGARRDRSAARAAASRTRHPLEMVVWSAEEGVAFGRGLAGSRIVAGDVDAGGHGRGLERHAPRRRRPQARRRSRSHHGRRPAEGRAPRVPRAAHRAGRHARASRTPIGVVEGIVAIERYSAVVTGFANHAGTTPMAGAAGRARRRLAADARRARDRDARAGTAGRHRRPARRVVRTRRTSFPARSG